VHGDRITLLSERFEHLQIAVVVVVRIFDEEDDFDPFTVGEVPINEIEPGTRFALPVTRVHK
jgi:hypothetical protein